MNISDLPPNPDDPEIDVLGKMMRTSQLIYIAVYFGLMFGGLIALMIYNIIKVFGWDKDIDKVQNETLSWFLTPSVEGDDEGEEAAA